MFAVTITFSIRLGAQAGFMASLNTHLAALISEDTQCLRTEAYGDPSRPGKVMSVQVFASSETFEAYRASPLARDFDSEVVDMVTGRSIATWSEIIEHHKA